MLAALRAICSAWEVPQNEAITTWIHEAIAMRRGELSGPALPFELSLKREGERLSPLVRVVDMQPPTPRGWPTHDSSCARRRQRVRELARGLNEGSTARALDEFVDMVDAHQEIPSGLSYGIEVPLRNGPPRTQLYLHVPNNVDASRALVRDALRWSGADESAVARFTAFSDPRIIALITHAPTPEDPRRIKIYVSAPLDTRDLATGLQPPSAPAYAPSKGLAVLRCGVGGPIWEKWDFRCTAHFQHADVVFDDFVRGMRAEDAARVRKIVDGRHFAPWPTWVSMRPKAQTIYFVPR